MEYVMEGPSVQDARRLITSIDERLLQLFSWEIEGSRYCSLRWLGFSLSEIPAKLAKCMTHVTSDGLSDWFVTNTERMSRDSRLPFRLCFVRPTDSGWAVAGFLSMELEKNAADWAMGRDRRKANELANLLENRFLRGGLGIFFERWLFESLGDGMTLTIRRASGTGTDPHVFEGIRMISGYSLEMKSSIVYKLDRATFPSIEAYILLGTEWLLLQSTVSDTHSGARFEHVSEFIALADQTSDQRVKVPAAGG
jgi:hypothetical protein